VFGWYVLTNGANNLHFGELVGSSDDFSDLLLENQVRMILVILTFKIKLHY
jgi:hypothetical protein